MLIRSVIDRRAARLDSWKLLRHNKVNFLLRLCAYSLEVFWGLKPHDCKFGRDEGLVTN